MGYMENLNPDEGLGSYSWRKEEDLYVFVY